MINRYDRIDPVCEQNALISVCTLGKNRRHRYVDTNKDPCPCFRARGSNRFKLIQIRIMSNRFHVRRMPHGKIALGGLLTARADQLSSSRSHFFSDRRRFSRAFVGPHRTFSRWRISLMGACRSYKNTGCRERICRSSDAKNLPPEIRQKWI